MSKILLEIGSRKIKEEEFVNAFFYLLIGYFLFDRVDISKFSKSDVVKLSKILFDLTLEEVVSRNSIMELAKLKDKELPIINKNDEGEELEQIIREKLNILEIDSPLVSLLDSSLIQSSIEEQYFISKLIEEFLVNEGTVSYDNIKNYYNKNFEGFPLLSFLFVSLPSRTKKKLIEDIKKEMRESDPYQMEKNYLKDSEKIVYYYEDIDVFDYFTTDEDFESQKMFKLLDILSMLGLDPDNLKLSDEVKKGEIISISTSNRENFYLFDKIEYNKPEFNDKIYEYIKQNMTESLYDEIYFKLYEESLDKIRVKYYEDNLKELEKTITPISKIWFEKFDRLFGK
ncbi:MAG: hypothetical protein ACP5PT_08710 [Brevinematia bacterium]